MPGLHSWKKKKKAVQIKTTEIEHKIPIKKKKYISWG